MFNYNMPNQKNKDQHVVHYSELGERGMGNSRSGLCTQRKVCVGREHPGLQKARDLPRLVERLPSMYKALHSILGTHKIRFGINYSSTGGGRRTRNSKFKVVFSEYEASLRYMR